MSVSPAGNAQALALRSTVERDIDQLMRWFLDEPSIRVWGGPKFRYPFTRHSFLEDIHWGRTDAFSLCGGNDRLAAFGQLYVHHQRINLARLVVDPARRGRGIGKLLIHRLLATGREIFECREYSLFVFRDNEQALRCYRSMGFRISSYPEDTPLGNECYYLTRPVELPRTDYLGLKTTTGGNNVE